jgi:lipopolysaccharide/colanic/teichoic acid biosynthesis glycosyltransferase
LPLYMQSLMRTRSLDIILWICALGVIMLTVLLAANYAASQLNAKINDTQKQIGLKKRVIICLKICPVMRHRAQDLG